MRMISYDHSYLRIIISFLVMTCSVHTTEAQWSPVNVSVSSDLYSVHTTGNKIGIGGSGEVIISDDGGSNWATLPVVDQFGSSLFCGAMYSVHFFNQNTGLTTGIVAMGNSETMLRTTNGGANWTAVNVYNGGSILRYLDDIHFPTSSNGFACGSNGRIIKTTDGGLTWTSVSSGTNLYKSLWFTTSSTGCVVATNMIKRTIDGGSNWTSIPVTGALTSITFGDLNTGYASGDGVIYKTTDAGATWQLLFEPFTSTGAVFATSPDTIYLAADNGLYISRDGGQYWECFNTISNVTINDIYFEDDFYGYAVGTDGKVFRTYNGGGTSAPVSYFTYTPVSVCPDSTILFNSYGPVSNTYQWLFNGIPFSTSANTSWVFTDPGKRGQIDHLSAN